MINNTNIDINMNYNIFLIENFNNIKNNIHDLYFFIQDEKEIVYIPDFWWHGLINLDNSLGITFSWEKDKK
jgi:dTDP-4-dehydrorhamnose 3,5-epimerase-like enzyme